MKTTIASEADVTAFKEDPVKNLSRLENKRVGGSLGLNGCIKLTRLPEGLRVGGNLWLEGCTRLTSLPEGLWVGGSLDLSDCTSLTSLPEGLQVGGSLGLGDCELLKRALIAERKLEWLQERVGGTICW